MWILDAESGGNVNSENYTIVTTENTQYYTDYYDPRTGEFIATRYFGSSIKVTGIYIISTDRRFGNNSIDVRGFQLGVDFYNMETGEITASFPEGWIIEFNNNIEDCNHINYDDNRKVTIYRKFNSISKSDFMDILYGDQPIDHDLIYLSTNLISDYGVCKIYGTFEKEHPNCPDDPLISNTITSVGTDSDGTIYFEFD